MSNEYGVRDLILALIHAREDRTGHVDLVKYSANKYLAIGGALGLRSDEMPPIEGGAQFGGDMLGDLFESALRSYEQIRSPFASYLEAPEVIIRLYRHHGPRIADSVSAVRLSILELLVDLATLRWGLPPALHVTSDDLRDHGFDPDASAPEPLDYM